jgi:hypothetical protein
VSVFPRGEKSSLQFITKFSQQLFSFALILLTLDPFGRRSVHNSENSPALFRFRNDDFNRVGCGTINGTDFLTLADCIEDIDRESVLKDDEKGVTRSHIADVVRRGLNEFLIISLVSHEARAGRFVEGNSELDAGHRSDQDLIKIFDGLDEMALPQNDVAPFWKCQADRF